jgi:hypothetical protein
VSPGGARLAEPLMREFIPRQREAREYDVRT